MNEDQSSRHPALAAFLSFLFPGLGQAYAGNRRLALVLAVPVLVLIILGVGLAFVDGRQALNALLSASFLTALIALDVALLVWRLFAIAQAGLTSQPTIASGRPPMATPAGAVAESRTVPGARRAGTLALVALLLVATVGMHAWAGLIIEELNSTLGDVFGGQHNDPNGNGTGNGGPLNRPTYSWDGTDRINFLLLGIDSGPGRNEALTDTILAVSVDPVSHTAVMISVPRDTAMTPLPDRSVYADGLYPRKINQLSTDASANPALWCPDLPVEEATSCGLRTLERTIGLYLGIEIQYYATVDLEGFTNLIDAVGPLQLCLDGTLNDPTYQGPGDTWLSRKRGVILQAGCHYYQGRYALAYARARKGTLTLPDGTVQQLDDFMRADRQQQVLLELRRRFADMDVVFKLPKALRAIGATVHTDFARDRAGDLASLVPLIAGPDIKRVVLGLPRFVDPPADPTVNYVLTPRRKDIRRQMRRLFGSDQLQGWYLASNADGPPS